MKTRLTAFALTLGAAALFLVPAHANAARSMGGIPSTGPAYTPAAATPLRAVATVVRPFIYLYPETPRTICDALLRGGAVTDACPITARLRRYMQRREGLSICRCQNLPGAVSWALVDNNGRVAHVDTHWYYSSHAYIGMTFVVRHQHAGWLVDDSYCTGRPQSSLYLYGRSRSLDVFSCSWSHLP